MIIFLDVNLSAEITVNKFSTDIYVRATPCIKPPNRDKFSYVIIPSKALFSKREIFDTAAAVRHFIKLKMSD